MTISVLVVEDGPHHQKHFQQIFLQLGIYTVLAESAEQGVQLLKKHRVDAIFLDYNLPGMNGLDFIAETRSLLELNNIPVIMMSTDLMINEMAVKNGLAQAWVVKRATVAMVEKVLKDLKVW